MTSRVSFSAALALAFATSIFAQEPGDPGPDGIVRPDRTYVYSAKFLCLSAAGPGADQTEAFRSSQYITVLNMLNKNFEPANLRVQAIGATQLNSGIPSPKAGVGSRIDPEEARFLTCFDARRLAGDLVTGPAIQFEGYILIESDRPLDIDAVYSTLKFNGPLGVQTTIDVENVRASRRRQPFPIPLPLPEPFPLPSR